MQGLPVCENASLGKLFRPGEVFESFLGLRMFQKIMFGCEVNQKMLWLCLLAPCFFKIFLARNSFLFCRRFCISEFHSCLPLVFCTKLILPTIHKYVNALKFYADPKILFVFFLYSYIPNDMK
jgi:hypothetical protein